MIRIDQIWLATEPLDMRAGPDTALARVVQVFGSARPHCAYLFAHLKDVLTKLPTQKNNTIEELLFHN
jgi:hypothetical protein